MSENNKLDFSAVVNEVFKLMLHYDEKKDMSGIMKKSMVLKILKSHYKLTEDQIELISNFIDIIVLFHKIHRGSNLFKNCWKCS
jgi:hypothetical protein